MCGGQSAYWDGQTISDKWLQGGVYHPSQKGAGRQALVSMDLGSSRNKAWLGQTLSRAGLPRVKCHESVKDRSSDSFSCTCAVWLSQALTWDTVMPHFLANSSLASSLG